MHRISSCNDGEQLHCTPLCPHGPGFLNWRNLFREASSEAKSEFKEKPVTLIDLRCLVLTRNQRMLGHL